MKWIKGIGLLLISNLLIGIALFVVFNVLAYVVLPAFGFDIRASVNDMLLLYAFVLGMGGDTFDRFVRDASFCSHGQRLRPAFSPTTDNRACLVGWRCYDESREDR